MSRQVPTSITTDQEILSLSTRTAVSLSEIGYSLPLRKEYYAARITDNLEA